MRLPMVRRAPCALLIFASVCWAGPLAAQLPDSSTRTGAYLDKSAEDLVRLARQRRQIADLSVESYKALSKERISVGLRGIRRDRLLYRREVAGRIEWTRYGEGRITILGAREAVPVAIKNVQLPSDLDSFMPHLAFDPADNRMLLDWGDGEFVRHPLADGAERYYRYRTGNTTSIQLPNGRVVHLVELEILPRKTDPHNISGSFWLDADTHAVVQAAFRLARDIDFTRDRVDDDPEKNDVPGWLKPLTATLDYVTIEYGLYDLKWWMPRSVLFEGSVRAGFIHTPMQYERTYSNYEIHGADTLITAPIAEILKRDSIERASVDSCQNKVNVSIHIGGGSNHARPDSTPTIKCGRWTVVMAADTNAMLTSPELPPNPFATGEQLVSEGELRELGERIKKLGGGPSVLSEPVTDVSVLSVSQFRYNRIEGPSFGARGTLDWGRYKVLAKARIGLADLEPNFDVGVQSIFKKRSLTLAGYRRLNAFDPYARPFSFGSSLDALLFGNDEADYYRTLGGELVVEPNASGARWYTARLFAQKESAAAKKTDFSLAHALHSEHVFDPNIQADAGTEYGSEITLRFNHGLNPDALRIGGEIYGHGAMGTNDFGRGAVTLRATFPLTSSLSAALEGASGLTSSKVPLQHLWYMGGSNTLRGYHASALSGEAFWRGRAELGFGLPAVRLVGFSDAAWAGARDQFGVGKPLISVGAGASFLDGIIRFDVARGLRAPKGWTTTLYFDAAL